MVIVVDHCNLNIQNNGIKRKAPATLLVLLVGARSSSLLLPDPVGLEAHGVDADEAVGVLGL